MRDAAREVGGVSNQEAATEVGQVGTPSVGRQAERVQVDDRCGVADASTPADQLTEDAGAGASQPLRYTTV
jgi:hypothetical protein